MKLLKRSQSFFQIKPLQELPASAIMFKTVLLWILPLAIVGIWLCIPLTLDGKTLHPALYLVWRGLYFLGGGVFFFPFFCVGMPLPSARQQMFVLTTIIVCALIGDVVLDYAGIDPRLRTTLSFFAPSLAASTGFLISMFFMFRSMVPTMATQTLELQVRSMRTGTLSSDTGILATARQGEERVDNNVTDTGEDTDGPEAGAAKGPAAKGPVNVTVEVVREEGVEDDHAKPANDEAQVATSPTSQASAMPSFAGRAAQRRRTEKDKAFQAVVEAVRFTSMQNFLSRFFVRAMLSFVILIMYFQCIVLTIYVSPALNTDSQRTILAICFPFSLRPWSFVAAKLGKKIDRETANPPFRMEYITVWLRVIYDLFFYRQLFVNIEAIETVVLLNLVNVGMEVIAYPLRMSEYGYRLEKWFLRNVVRTTISEKFTLEEHRNLYVVSFWFICMAERISLTAYIILLSVTNYNYNSVFFPFHSDGASYEELTYFCFIMLLIEWAGSTIVTLIILFVFKENVLMKGGRYLISPHMLLITVAAACHVASDVYIARFVHPM